jgi:hypothetical protein
MTNASGQEYERYVSAILREIVDGFESPYREQQALTNAVVILRGAVCFHCEAYGRQEPVGLYGSSRMGRASALEEGETSERESDWEGFVVRSSPADLYSLIYGVPVPSPRPSWTSDIESRAAIDLVELVSDSPTVRDDLNESRALLDDIRCLVEKGDLRGARTLVESAEANGPAGDDLEGWSRALAPPTITRTQARSTRSVRSNASWLREQSHRFPGQWVALRDGVLLGSSASRVVLQDALRGRQDLVGALFVRMPG